MKSKAAYFSLWVMFIVIIAIVLKKVDIVRYCGFSSPRFGEYSTKNDEENDLHSESKLILNEKDKLKILSPQIELFYQVKAIESTLLNNLPIVLDVAMLLPVESIEIPTEVLKKANSEYRSLIFNKNVITNEDWKKNLTKLKKANVKIRSVFLTSMKQDKDKKDTMVVTIKAVFENNLKKTFIFSGLFQVWFHEKNKANFKAMELSFVDASEVQQNFYENWAKKIELQVFDQTLITDDFDGDGFIDFFIPEEKIFLFNEGNGTFDSEFRLNSSDTFVAGTSYDFNADGKADLLLHKSDGKFVSYIMTGMRGQANQKQVDFPQIENKDVLISVVDKNFDGHPDILIASKTEWPFFQIEMNKESSPILFNAFNSGDLSLFNSSRGINSMLLNSNANRKTLTIYTSSPSRGTEAWEFERSNIRKRFMIPREMGGGGDIDIVALLNEKNEQALVAGQDSFACNMLNTTKFTRIEFQHYDNFRQNLNGRPYLLNLDNGKINEAIRFPYQGFTNLFSPIDTNSDSHSELFFKNGYWSTDVSKLEYDFDFWLYDFYPPVLNESMSRKPSSQYSNWYDNQPDKLIKIDNEKNMIDIWPGESKIRTPRALFTANEDVNNDGIEDLVNFDQSGMLSIFVNKILPVKKNWLGFAPLANNAIPEKIKIIFENGKSIEKNWYKVVKGSGKKSGRMIIRFTEPKVEKVIVQLSNGLSYKLKNITLNRYYNLDSQIWSLDN